MFRKLDFRLVDCRVSNIEDQFWFGSRGLGSVCVCVYERGNHMIYHAICTGGGINVMNVGDG